jgi:adenylate kinase
MINVALFGPPGAGKGTQSKKIIQKYQLVHIAPGDLLREQINLKTALGYQAAKYINEGKLAPNALVIDIVEDQLIAKKGGVAFYLMAFQEQLSRQRHWKRNWQATTCIWMPLSF